MQRVQEVESASYYKDCRCNQSASVSGGAPICHSELEMVETEINERRRFWDCTMQVFGLEYSQLLRSALETSICRGCLATSWSNVLRQ